MWVLSKIFELSLRGDGEEEMVKEGRWDGY